MIRYVRLLFMSSLFTIPLIAQMPAVGTKAPSFALPDANGKTVKLTSLIKHSYAAVYFYPKAGTSGCTKQACNIRDNDALLRNNKIKVVGVSTDSVNALAKFTGEQILSFPLLSDVGGKITAKYGVLREDGYAKRVTFIIDKKGIIRHIIEKVNVLEHAAEIVNAVNSLPK